MSCWLIWVQTTLCSDVGKTVDTVTACVETIGRSQQEIVRHMTITVCHPMLRRETGCDLVV
jgi:hypothetical protein